MLNSFNKKGIWWLPENPKNQFFGDLHYDPHKGLILKIMNINSDIGIFLVIARTRLKINIILGVTSDGKQITLSECEQANSENNICGISMIEYHIRVAFVGAHFVNEQDMKFSNMYVRYTHLDEWVNMSGFSSTMNINYKTNTLEKVVMEYTYIKPFSIASIQDFTFSVDFSVEGFNIPLKLTEFTLKLVQSDLEIGRIIIKPITKSVFDSFYNISTLCENK